MFLFYNESLENRVFYPELDKKIKAARKEKDEDKLVTIGAHTKSHTVLSHLTHESAHKEIEEAQKILQYKINQEINHFAYPFGEEKDFSFKDIDILKQLGFKSAVSTRSDYLKCCL